MDRMEHSPDTPSPNSRYRSPSSITCTLSPQLLSKVTGIPIFNRNKYSELQVLDLHLRERSQGEISIIENLDICPNLILLNLSYNSITVVQRLDCLVQLVELNLAENSIRFIQNLSPLRNLLRLNLSGNQIVRIPGALLK